MKCPQCGFEMEHGFLTAGGYRILWTPERRRWTSLSGTRDIVLQRLRFSGKNDTTSWLCRRCRKVVLEY